MPPVASYQPYLFSRPRPSSVAVASILFLGASLRLWTASPPFLPQILAGIAGIGLVFMVVRDGFGEKAAMLAAMFYAMAAAPVIQSFSSRFIAPAVFCSMFSLFFAIRSWNHAENTDSCLSGLFLGLAAALNLGVLPIGVLPLLVNLVMQQGGKSRRTAVFFGSFLLAYFFVGLWRLPGESFSYVHLTESFRWNLGFLTISIPEGLGWPLALSGYAGWAWTGLRLAAKRDFVHSGMDSPYFFALLWFLGASFVTFIYLFLRPPAAAVHSASIFLAAFAGAFLSDLLSHRLAAVRALGLLSCLFVIFYTFAYSAAHTALYRSMNPSDRASAWILQNIPKGESIGIARNDSRTPACLQGGHPDYDVLEGGGADAPLDQCVLKLDQIKNEAHYLVLREKEYGLNLTANSNSATGKILKKIEEDFAEIARFSQSAEFLGLKFSHIKNPRGSSIYPYEDIRILKKNKI